MLCVENFIYEYETLHYTFVVSAALKLDAIFTMEILKVKFKLNGLELELEGNEKTVRDELAAFKEFVANNVIPKIGSFDAIQTPLQIVDEQSDASTTYPQLKEIVMKDLPKTEIEWILIYCFYASKFGNDSFTEADIKELYEVSKRRNVNRMKNFSANFAKVLSNGCTRILNENEYIIVKKGIEQAINIVTEMVDKTNSETATVKRSKKQKTKSATRANVLSIVSSISLASNGKGNLKNFYNEYSTKSFFQRNLLFIYFLEKIIEVEDIGLSHLYTCYKYLGEKLPGNLYQSVIDTKNSKGWIDTKDMNKLRITIHGESIVEHELKM